MPLTGNGKSTAPPSGPSCHRVRATAGIRTEHRIAAGAGATSWPPLTLARGSLDLGIRDFFAIGGDSVLATAVVARIRE